MMSISVASPSRWAVKGLEDASRPEGLHVELDRAQRDLPLDGLEIRPGQVLFRGGEVLPESALAAQLQRLADHGKDVVREGLPTEVLDPDVDQGVQPLAGQTRGFCRPLGQALGRTTQRRRLPRLGHGLRQRQG